MEGLDFSQLQGGTELDLFSTLETQVNEGIETPSGEQGNDKKKQAEKQEEPIDVLEVLGNNETDELNDEDKGVKEKSKAPPQQHSKSSIPFSSVFKSLIEEDALSNFDEQEFAKDEQEHGAAVAIVNVFKKEADLARQSALDEVEADKKEVLSIYSNLLDAGVDTDTAKQLLGDKIKFEQIKSEDLEADDKQDLRIAVITQDLKNSGLSDKKIKTIVQNFIDTGKDVEEAKEAHANVIEFNKTQIKLAEEQKKQEIAQKETQRKEIVKKYSEFVDNMEEPIPGIKINKQTKEKIKNGVLSGDLWKIRDQDPIKFDNIVYYAVTEGLLNGKFDKLQAKSKSSAIKELENILGTSKKSGGTPVLEMDEDDKSGDNLISFLNKNKAKGF